MKKILAGAAAAALAVSAMSGAAFAVEVEGAPKTMDTAWGSQWCQFSLGEEAPKEDYFGYTVTFTVKSDCDYDDDNNMVAKVYSPNKDAEGNVVDLLVIMAEEGKTEYTGSFTISEDNIDAVWQTWNAVAFQFQCGHLAPVELEAIAAEKAADPAVTEPEATEPEATEPEATEPVTTEPVVTAPVTTSAEVTTGIAGNVGGNTDTNDKNKPTGLAIAVVPAALAGAAAVIAKKRK